MNLQDKQERMALIQRYLDAETSIGEERILAEYLRNHAPDADEKAVAVLVAAGPDAVQSQPAEAAMQRDTADFDRVLRLRGRRHVIAGCALLAAAALAAVLFLPGLRHRTEAVSGDEEIPGLSTEALIRQVSSIAELDLSAADRIECRPCGNAFLLTASFPDGDEITWLLTRLDTDGPLNMLTINQKP